MKDDSNPQIFGKFSSNSDKIMAGKPCENCTCGLKEYDIYLINQL
jgi:hypothetical protein